MKRGDIDYSIKISGLLQNSLRFDVLIAKYGSPFFKIRLVESILKLNKCKYVPFF
jgi:hypothetical protein